MDILQDFENRSLQIPRQALRNYSPEARIFPQLQSQQEVELLSKIVGHPPIGEDTGNSWFAQPYAELHRSNDTDRFVEDESDGDYPVYQGSNVYQFTHDSSFYDVTPPEFWSVEEDADEDLSAKQRIREKNYRKLKRGLYHAYDGTGSQKQFVNDLLEDRRGSPLSKQDVLLDSTEYRIVFRDITKFSNERTIVASVIPPDVVCTNTLHTIRPYNIEPAESDLSCKPLHSVLLASVY